MRRTIRVLAKAGLAVAAVATCCAGGAAVTALLRPAGRVEPGDGAAAPEAVTEAAPEAPPRVTGPAQLDQLLLDGRYADALAAGEVLRESAAAGPARDALEFRLGLCREVLGRRDEALEAYGALAGRSPDTPAGAAAVAGQARLWLRVGKPDRARRLLAELLLRAGRPPLRGHPALGDVPLLLAAALAREAGPSEAPGPGNDAPAHPAVVPAVEPSLSAVKWDAAAPPADPGFEAPAVQKAGPSPEAWTVTAAARQAVALDFLNDVAAKAGLKVEWAADARKQAAGRTLAVAADRVPLADLLRTAAAAADLGWELADGKLTFSTFPPPAAPARQAAARRALLEAATANPEHPLAGVLAVELGDLELAAGRLKESAGWYERLIREKSRAAALTEAYYGLGLVRARSGERGPARDAFYRAVDRAPSGPLAALGYLHVGRLYLEEANPALAARALRRVSAGDAPPRTRTAAGLLLAAAELLDDNPRAAHAAVAGVRRWAGEEPLVRPAALLDALARYRAAADPGRRERVAGDLLEALLAYREESVLGPVGLVLAGQGYRDVGLGDEMAALYEKARPGVGSELALAMKADLAEHLLASGKKGAAPLLREVAAAPGPRAARAELGLAALALKGDRPDECLSHCRKVLSAGDAAAAGDAVRLMGQAYTRKGDHVAAARCFAGRPPAAEAGAPVAQ